MGQERLIFFSLVLAVHRGSACDVMRCIKLQLKPTWQVDKKREQSLHHTCDLMRNPSDIKWVTTLWYSTTNRKSTAMHFVPTQAKPTLKQTRVENEKWWNIFYRNQVIHPNPTIAIVKWEEGIIYLPTLNDKNLQFINLHTVIIHNDKLRSL